MKKILFFIVGIVIFISTQVFADVRITVSKSDASLCAVVPTQAPKFNNRSVRHYNKFGEERRISSDLWNSAKNGLSFFKLNKAQNTSQTVQLAFVDKYSTFWYYTKKGSRINGPYFYDFIVPERESYEKKLFVDIELELPCSCFRRSDKPKRCVKNDGINIHIYKDKAKNWWEKSGKDKASKTGENVGKGSRKAWEALKKSAQTIRNGWEEQKKREKE